MQNNETELGLTEVVSSRVTPQELSAFKEHAARAGKRVSDWVRETLCNSLEISPAAYSQLVFQAMASETIRLTLIAAQNEQDITTRESHERLERQARASAEAITERWLALTKAKKGTA